MHFWHTHVRSIRICEHFNGEISVRCERVQRDWSQWAAYRRISATAGMERRQRATRRRCAMYQRENKEAPQKIRERVDLPRAALMATSKPGAMANLRESRGCDLATSFHRLAIPTGGRFGSLSGTCAMCAYLDDTARRRNSTRRGELHRSLLHSTFFFFFLHSKQPNTTSTDTHTSAHKHARSTKQHWHNTCHRTEHVGGCRMTVYLFVTPPRPPL